MGLTPAPTDVVREYRNSRLYRSLTRTLRIYNRRLLAGLHARGFTDFQPAFPALLSNLDLAGTRIGVLAQRAGVTRQAAGQLLRAIERAGYVESWSTPDDARATVVRFTARGRKLLAAVIELVDQVEAEFAAALPEGNFGDVRDGLRQIADHVDPVGAFGSGDEGQPRRRRR